MTYLNTGLVCCLVTALLCVVPTPGPGLIVAQIVLGLFGSTLVIGTTRRERGL